MNGWKVESLYAVDLGEAAEPTNVLAHDMPSFAPLLRRAPAYRMGLRAFVRSTCRISFVGLSLSVLASEDA
jgi:hypothetical protein